LAVVAATPAVAAVTPGTALAAAHAKAHGAQATPTKVIDASDPAQQQAAADALNSGCANTSNCTWSNDTPVTGGYGPPSILGDVLYNCDPQSYAQTSVGISDERQESTSVSERVSLTISLKFLNLAESTAAFSAFSKQSESFSTSVTSTNTVAAAPGEKGWTVTELQSANVTGSAYITAGINQLIQVKNIDLSFPGYQDPNSSQGSAVVYTGIKERMTPDDVKAACDSSTVTGAAVLRAAEQPPGTFKLNVCPRNGHCRSRAVTGSLPPDVRRATARITRAGRTYGNGTYTRGRPKLVMRRPLKAGHYKLILREPASPSQQLGPAPLTAIETTVPITVGG